MAKKLAIAVEIVGKDSLSSVLKRLNTRMKAVSARMRSVGRGIGMPFRVATAPLRLLARGVGRLTRGMRGLLRGISSVLRPIAVFGGAAVAASAGVLKLVTDTAKAGDELGKLSRQLGFGVEELQELQFAAERSGVPVDMFSMSMRQFTTRLGQAKSGFGELRTFLATTPKSFQAAVKGARTTGEAFELVIDAISKVEDPTRRAALAGKFFGEEGVKLTRMAEGGVIGLRRLREEKRAYGVMTEAQIKASEEFSNALTNLAAAVMGVKISLTGSMLPALQVALQRMTGWVKINRDLIAQRIGSFITKIGESLKKVNWKAFADGLEKALVIGMDLLTSFGTIAVGVMSGDMTEATKGFKRAWETLKPFVVRMLDWLRQKFRDFGNWIKTDFKNSMQNAVMDSLNFLGKFTGGGGSGLFNLFGGGKVPYIPRPMRMQTAPTVGAATGASRPIAVASTVNINAPEWLRRVLDIQGEGSTATGGRMRMADAGRSGVA